MWEETTPRLDRERYFGQHEQKIHIGDNVIFGPGVTIITGNHPTNIVGRRINSIKESEKPLDCDQDVVIDNDVWIGCNSTILKGVHIHEGAVVAAGSVVTRNIPSYEIWGVPAKGSLYSRAA